MAETLEKTVKGLQQEIGKCQHEIGRLQAVVEIQNMMSAYCYLHAANRHKEVMKMYAKKSPDSRIYMGELGYWEGYDAAERAWSLLDRLGGGKPAPGMMALHPMVSPMVVVAGDGKTAKGMWLTTGFVAHKDKAGVLGATWEWGTYGIDFIKEDGQWKFWHFHIYRLFRTGWDKGLKDWNPDAEVMKVPDDIKPDGPGVDDYPYRPNEVFILKPDLPEPYEKWDKSLSY
jgi:hypothetical protein